MSRNGNRWYVLGRVTPVTSTEPEPIVPGTEYEFVGWCRTKEAMVARRDKLDRAGRHGIHVFSPSRAQAALDAMAMYGVKVQGYISLEDRRAGRMIVKAAVMREIFCPYTGVILDMRRAVVVVSSTSQVVCAATHWDTVKDGVLATFTKARLSVDVYDGRELFK